MRSPWEVRRISRCLPEVGSGTCSSRPGRNQAVYGLVRGLPGDPRSPGPLGHRGALLVKHGEELDQRQPSPLVPLVT
ncbi:MULTISPECIES: hypothetical protein [unclassified Streptomyces]|uniref:hypothetical protein n=1 Tax=unclassified Streptomyces TaxID=2593676 RepID=UPI0032D5767A